jgi:hypothetical protein
LKDVLGFLNRSSLTAKAKRQQTGMSVVQVTERRSITPTNTGEQPIIRGFHTQKVATEP